MHEKQLQEMELTEGLTREELVDFANDPSVFKAGNEDLETEATEGSCKK